MLLSPNKGTVNTDSNQYIILLVLYRTASGYDFRYTFDDPTALIVDFINCKTINETDIIQGDLRKPASAGELEEFVVKVPELPVDASGETLNSTRFAFAVRVYDSDMNAADPSNVAALNFFIAPLVLPTASTTATPASTRRTPAFTIKTTKQTTTKQTPSPCKECLGKCSLCVYILTFAD